MKRKIFVVIIALMLLLCSGCSKEIQSQISNIKKMAESTVSSQLEPGAYDKNCCTTELIYVQDMLNEHTAHSLKQFLSSRIKYSNETIKKYAELSENLLSAELNNEVLDLICKDFIDDELNIKGKTISDLKFEIKSMIDFVEYIEGRAVMTNRGVQQNVIVKWYPRWARKDGSWAVYSIKADN